MTSVQFVVLAALCSTILSSPSFPFSMPPPPLAGPGLGLVGPPPPFMFPPLRRPRPRRILIIRPPPGAHFPFSDHPMRLGFRPLPHQPFVERPPAPFRPPLPRRRPSRDDDIVRHMASKYGYRRPGLYRSGPPRTPGYRRFRDRSTGSFRDLRRPFYPTRHRNRYHDSFDRYSGFDFGIQGDQFGMPGGDFRPTRVYSDGYTRSRSRLGSGRDYLQRRPSGFGRYVSDRRGGYLSEFETRNPFRSSESLRASRPRIYTRPSNLRPSLSRSVIQDITGAFRDGVKSGVSSSFGRSVLDLSKTRSIPVDRSPVSSNPVFDGAVDLTKVKTPAVNPKPGSIRKGKAIRKPIKKSKGKKKPKITKQRTKPIKAVVKDQLRVKGTKKVVKQIPKQPTLPPKPKTTPLNIPVKVVPKPPVKPSIKPQIEPPHAIIKTDGALPPPPVPKVIPKFDAVVPPVKSDIVPPSVVDTLPQKGASVKPLSPSLTLDTIVDLHQAKPQVEPAGPANLLATSQSLNVDPLAPGVSIVELGPGASTGTILSGSDLNGLGNVDVLTLSTEGFAALERAIQSGKTISADVLDSIIGKGGASGTTAIGKGEPAPEIVVIDHPTAGHGAGHGVGTGAPGGTPQLLNNNPNVPPIAQATKVLSGGHAGHKNLPIDIPNYPDSARQAILDLSVPMHSGQRPSHSVDGVGVVGDSVGSVEAKGSNDLLGIFAVPSGSTFPKVPKSVSSIPSSIGKLLTGGTNEHSAHAAH